MVKNTRSGFSLVEIILAVGIIGVAMLAIFGLFGTSLRTNAETLAQHEFLGMSRSVRDFLASTNTGAGFTNVFGWVRDTNSQPEIYSFTQTNGVVTNGLGSNAAFVTATTSRGGRLFRLRLTLSPNMPLLTSSGTLVARPSVGDLPASAASFTNNAVLPVRVQAFSVPATGTTLQNTSPAFSYDTVVPR
jgi:prepilin-type N-terminal cleavage/methylation domain-containing protein